MAVLKTPLLFFSAKNYEPKNEGKNIKGQKIRHVPKGQGLS